ncbi:leucine-rich repeat-containing protein 72-like isoform X3 [Babylonia areolata]|uniref:leucine-rich repeat-containing protein 72-like isoform X3 n=1 Tax=Babylonia areolata TaxID=304850 RepID=UPI003FD5CD09
MLKCTHQTLIHVSVKRGLTEVCDLRRFRFLKKIWLNGNKLRQVFCFPLNFRICELHLNNNELIDISGSLGHLTCLQLCMLHNNQLTKLDKVTTEFRKMQNLHTLNLFDNPIAQEPEYRLFVVYSCPSVQLLDRHEVTKKERDMAGRIYDQSQEKIRERVAFGRRSQGPPSLYYPATPQDSVPAPADGKVFGDNYLRNIPTFEDQEDAVNSRRLKKSLTVYSSFDWSKVPRIEQRRTSEQTFGNPEIITRVYR